MALGLRDELEKEGYSKEEEYFYNLNRELIEKRRKDLDFRRRSQQVLQERASHWMKCPKCGHEMKELTYSGICLDQCTGCRGIYLDLGEIETLFRVTEPRTLLRAIWARFGKAISNFNTDWKP